VIPPIQIIKKRVLGIFFLLGVTQLDLQVTDFVGFIVFDEKQKIL